MSDERCAPHATGFPLWNRAGTVSRCWRISSSALGVILSRGVPSCHRPQLSARRLGPQATRESQGAGQYQGPRADRRPRGRAGTLHGVRPRVPRRRAAPVPESGALPLSRCGRGSVKGSKVVGAPASHRAQGATGSSSGPAPVRPGGGSPARPPPAAAASRLVAGSCGASGWACGSGEARASTRLCHALGATPPRGRRPTPRPRCRTRRSGRLQRVAAPATMDPTITAPTTPQRPSRCRGSTRPCPARGVARCAGEGGRGGLRRLGR